METKHRTGLLLGVGAYTLWGLLPLYLKLLHGVPALQVLSHRVLWSVLLLVGLVLLLRRGRAVMAAARGRTLLLLCASAALIAVNWLVYIWAVLNGHVLEASLGYFLNPIVNVVLGMTVLRERIGRGQLAAIGLAVAGVAVMSLARGGSLWIPLALALSFGTYGLIRKMVAIDALGGLTVETLLLAPLCLALVLHTDASGQGAFGHDRTLDLLLIAAGAITAVPLLMFASAARRLRYTTMGLLQYIAPTLQFLEAVLLFGEPLRTVELIAFGLIWSGCALYAWHALRSSREPIPVSAPE
ncbi:EamA family transporter RarD [Sphingomonas sp. ID0503]|uniref:EamA family transporter RarD n=1 Tax=Sphingomonas sp. ID0503 TaxID=3399691 RepID=UPI003AFA2480